MPSPMVAKLRTKMAMGIQRSLKAGLRRHCLLVGDALFCPLTGVDVAMESDFGVTCKQQDAGLEVDRGLQASRAAPDGASGDVWVAVDLQGRGADVLPCSCLPTGCAASCTPQTVLQTRRQLNRSILRIGGCVG